MTLAPRDTRARRVCPRRAWALLLAAAGLAPSAFAGPPDTSGPQSLPQSPKRLVRLFTFEEPDNPHPVPDHWYHAQDDPTGVGGRRPGFPHYNRTEFDTTVAFSGQTSVRVPTRGGSTSLRLQGGEIPVFPDADYSVSARVRTADLEHARAFISARLLDQRLAAIPGSEVRSAPALSPGEWTTVNVLIAGRYADAAWLQIDLELLQPELFAPPPPANPALRQHVISRQDVSGAAYFDDVAVTLVPRTRFWTEQPSGVFVAPEKPTIGMLARDQAGEELSARVRVLDADGSVVAQQSIRLDPSARPVLWSPPLPGFGWFRAIMEIDAADVSVTRSEIWFASLPGASKVTPSAARTGDLARFGIIADTLGDHQLDALPQLLDRSGTRFLVLPALDASIPAERTRAALDARAPQLQRLVSQGQELTLALTTVPGPVCDKHHLDDTDALGMVSLDPANWLALIEPTLDVFGQRVIRYQVGACGDTHALRASPGPGLQIFEDAIARYVPGPLIGLAWRADHALPRLTRTGGATGPHIAPGPLADTLCVQYPLGLSARGMADLARDWRDLASQGTPVELTVVPELPPMNRFGAKARVIEASRRIAEFWGALADTNGWGSAEQAPPPARIALDAPWQATAGEQMHRLLPAPELAVLASMSERLAGRRLVSEIPAGPGVRAMLLAEHAGGSSSDSSGKGEALLRACVVAWNESAPPDRAWVDVYPLRDSVDVVDVFGNPLPRPGAAESSLSAAGSAAPTSGAGVQVRVPLGETPVFIEGVDAYLARFTSSFRLTPGFLPAVADAHELRVEMTNPWPIRVTGQIQVKEADAARKPGVASVRSAPWTFSPNLIEFALSPGETASLPVTATFGPGQLAGARDLWIVAKVVADRPYPAIRSAASVLIGLPDLELVPEVEFTPTPSGPDLIVVAAVTNKDKRTRALRLELTGKDIASQQSPISALGPGESIIKRFFIRDGAKLLAGRHVKVTLGDEDSAARLSKAAYIPGAR